MANEITFSTSLKVTKGDFTDSKSGSDTADMATATAAGGTPSIGTSSHEAILVTDVGTPGWAWFKNIDATNYVQIGVDVSATFYPFVKLLPGESCVLRLGTTAPYAKANTGAVKLQYLILDT